MMVDDLPRRHERQNGNRPPPPPFGRAGDTIVVADDNTSSSNNEQQRTPGRSSQTVLSRSNYRATSFAPPPFVPPVLSRPDSAAHQHPPPPSRRPITHHAASSNPSGVTGGWRAHQIIRVSLQRPMGIVFAANEESGCGVRIVDMPPQGAAASSQQLLVGDVLISINGRDCTMSNSKEVMELIGQAGEGYIDLAFQRITVPAAAAAAAAAETNNKNNAVASTKSTEDDDNDNNNDDDEGDSHPETTKLMQVTNLRWQNITSGVNGRYDGTVNQNMRPHGRGRFTSDSGQGSFEGRWEDGVVTSLDTNNNEASAAAAASSSNNNIAAAAASIPSATNNNDTLKRRRSAYTSSSDAMSCVTRMNSSSFNMADYPDAQPYPNNGQDTNTTTSTGGGGGGGGGGAPPQQQQQLQYYCLGETQRSSQHSIQSSSIEDIIQSVYALQISDFAFVRRSNGEWSFCQLVERNNNEEGEDVMTFVVNEVGHRKSLRPERWVKMVRACSSGVTIRGGGGGGSGGSLLSAPFSLSRSDSMERAPSF